MAQTLLLISCIKEGWGKEGERGEAQELLSPGQAGEGSAYVEGMLCVHVPDVADLGTSWLCNQLWLAHKQEHNVQQVVGNPP